MNTILYRLRGFPLILFVCGLMQVNTTAADELPEEGFRSMLIDRVTREFKKYVSEDEPRTTYDAMENFKAGVACVHWGDTLIEPYFMYSYYYYWHNKSPEGATKAALDRCEQERAKSERYANNCNCEIVLVGSEKKLNPPLQTVNALISELEKIPRPNTLCPTWIKDNEILLPTFGENLECPGYEGKKALRYDFLLERLDRIAKTDAPEIYPSAPAPQEVGEERGKIRGPRLYRDSDLRFSPPTDIPGNYTTRYNLPDGWGYEYQIHQIPVQFAAPFLARLNRVDGSKLFDRFSAHQIVDDRTMEVGPELYFAKYVRSYNLETNTDIMPNLKTSGAIFPENTASAAQGEHSTRLWVVATVPVNKDWIPLGKSLRTVEPLALQTNKALYIYSTEVTSLFRYRGSAGGNTLVEYHPVFDVSTCSDQKGCVEKTIATFRNELIKKFHEPPISAELDKVPHPPREFRLQRLYEKSNILDGFAGPWYEITTYTISIWDGSRYDGVWEDVANTERKLDANRIFVYVDLGLQIGVGQKGKYPEPSADQYAIYKKVIRDAVQDSVNATAGLLGGSIVDGVGMIATAKSLGESK
jgi:hypothetical protein